LILNRVDFWKIAPEEGKFKMASVWYEERKKARLFSRIKYLKMFEHLPVKNL